MKNTKRFKPIQYTFFIIVILTIMAVLFAALYCFVIVPKSVKQRIIPSYDNKYQIIVTIGPKENVKYKTAQIKVVDVVKNKTVYTCEDTYIKSDMRNIVFGNNSYDIWVVSRDTGVFCYRFEKGIWNKTVLSVETKNGKIVFTLAYELSYEVISAESIPRQILEYVIEPIIRQTEGT